ncbi:hypothetical protein MMPV_002177 [Pyropia vietnamensis]
MIPRPLLTAAAVGFTLAGVAAGAPARPATTPVGMSPTPWGARLAGALDAVRCEGLPPLTATLVGTDGNEDVTGSIAFSAVWLTAGDTSACVTRIEADVSGLPPATAHGFHIHTFGDVTLRDGKSAGGHFSTVPEMPHGLPEGISAVMAEEGAEKRAATGASTHHEGDLGNLESNSDGVVSWAGFNARVVLEHVVGRSVILHAAMDDGGQPTGNAGARLAQGIIGYKLVEAPAAPPPPSPPTATAVPEEANEDRDAGTAEE